MKYIILGFIAGAAIDFFFLPAKSGFQITGEWQGKIRSIDLIEQSQPKKHTENIKFPLKIDDGFKIISATGNIVSSYTKKDAITAFSENGNYYTIYEKVGSYIEFLNTKGDRFWRMKSLEYPSLSYGGKLILLMNGDQTKVRIVDSSGNETGDKEVAGRLCTALTFSVKGDNAGIGFVDGRYFVINDQGKILNESRVPEGNIVKGIEVSSNAEFAAVHYGNTVSDHLRIINIRDKNNYEYKLKNVYKTKNRFYISNEGSVLFVDKDNAISLSRKGSINFSVKIHEKRPGHCSIGSYGQVYVVAYTALSGESKLIMLDQKGGMLFSKDFSADSFLNVSIADGLIMIRGSDNVFCYRVDLPVL